MTTWSDKGVYNDKDRRKDPEDYIAYIAFAQTSFPPLMGILGGGFYFHNISLPVIRNSKHPENNARDVFFGYLAVFLCYVICGSLGYYGFSGIKFEDDEPSVNEI